MTSTRFATRLALAATAAAFSCGLALAADVPNIVGTWKATGEDYASVRLGAADDHNPQYATPTMGQPGDAWTIVIDTQQGRAFSGVAKPPKGDDEPIVGVISADGEHMLIAGNEAGMFGEFLGDKVEFCYQDQEPDRASVACFTAAKQ